MGGTRARPCRNSRRCGPRGNIACTGKRPDHDRRFHARLSRRSEGPRPRPPRRRAPEHAALIRMAHRLASEAEADLDDIWYYTATESGGIEIADRIIDSIMERFLLLAIYPYLGRCWDEDLRQGFRSFMVGAYFILYRVDAED